MQAAAQGGSAAGIGGRNAWGSRLQMPIPQDDSVGITRTGTSCPSPLSFLRYSLAPIFPLSPIPPSPISPISLFSLPFPLPFLPFSPCFFFLSSHWVKNLPLARVVVVPVRICDHSVPAVAAVLQILYKRTGSYEAHKSYIRDFTAGYQSR